MKSATSRKTGPRWTRRKDARPEEITASALELFVERGYASTRLEDVAARAGVSKGTVYLYFAGKEELFKAVVREGIASAIADARELIEHYQGSSISLLHAVARSFLERVIATRFSGIPKLVIAEARNFPEIAKFYLTEVAEPGQQALARIVERGIARGEFRAVNPREIAMLLVAPLLLIALWRNTFVPVGGMQFDPESLIEAHLAMIERGLGPEQRDVRTRAAR